MITDANNRIHFVPIKKTVGDYFIATIGSNIYAFSLRNARMLTYREFLSKAITVVQYDVSHYSSLSHHVQELELFLKKNNLPKVNMAQLSVMRILGRKETTMVNDKKKKISKYGATKHTNQIKDKLDKKYDSDGQVVKEYAASNFTQHDIGKLLEEIQTKSDEYPEETVSLKNYLDSLDIEYIVTPVRKLSEYLQDDLITTSSSFLGELLPKYQRLDNEHRGISNHPITAKISYLKLMAVGVMLTLIIGVAYFSYEEGYFDELLSGNALPGFQNPLAVPSLDPCSDASLQQKYTPLELRLALDDGRETCVLSKDLQELVDGVELPQVENNEVTG